MTTTTARRRDQFNAPKSRRAPKKTTATKDLAYALLDALAAESGVRWPSAKWRDDPVGFARDVLGVTLWAKQVQILEAIRDTVRPDAKIKRGAVKSGRKVSKSNTIVIACLWLYASFEDAKVIMTSTTDRQVNQILWLELQKVLARSGKCVACKAEDPEDRYIARPCAHSAIIHEKPSKLARTGITSPDFRTISGFTAREGEAVQGQSGKYLFYFADESSGIPNEIFIAMDGNRAGGATIWLFGNPTKNDGEFYEAFHSKAHLYTTITISSEETPNAVEGREVIPGLAGKQWIDEKKEEWGEDSAFYQIHVKGEFAKNEEGKIFSVHKITQAQERWRDVHALRDGEDELARDARIKKLGRLFVGIDPAGEEGTGDDEMFAARRGAFMFAPEKQPGHNDDQRLTALLRMLDAMKLPNEVPVVVLDAGGPIGTKFAKHVRDYLENNPRAFEFVTVYSSAKALRQPRLYDRVRDELTANLEKWMRAGGCVVEDTKLQAELHIMQWIIQVNGKAKVTPKPEIKKALGRSPDRYDACALACWEPMWLSDGIDDASDDLQAQARTERGSTGDEDDDDDHIDPYAGRNAWRR